MNAGFDRRPTWLPVCGDLGEFEEAAAARKVQVRLKGEGPERQRGLTSRWKILLPGGLSIERQADFGRQSRRDRHSGFPCRD
jgi:hypothetical protein